MIKKLPPPINVKGVRNFLGHAGFYRQFIKDFSKIAKPLNNLLNKDAMFLFDEDCLQEFNALKTSLVSAPVIIAPNWGQEFELMCDASDYAIGAVLGQRKDRVFHAIYYASRYISYKFRACIRVYLISVYKTRKLAQHLPIDHHI